MDPVFRWIESSALSVWTRESTSLIAYPAILSAHAIGMALAAGVNAAIALRLLGAASEISSGGDATVRRRRVDRFRDQRRVRYVAADRVSHQGADEPDVLPEAVAHRRRPRGFRRFQQAARTVDERGADVDRHRATRWLGRRHRRGTPPRVHVPAP